MMPKAPHVTAVVLSLLAVSSCRSREHADGDSDQDAALSADGAIRALASPRQIPMQVRPLDPHAVGYAPEVKIHPRAAKLCEAIHTLPARRKGECCASEPVAPLAAECARTVSASLDLHAIEVDDQAIERCAQAMRDALTGCDWVTPTPPPVPAACQGLVTGKLAVGSVCRSSLECEGHAHCEGAGPTSTGICRQPGETGARCGTNVDGLATYVLERSLDRTHPSCDAFCSLILHKCTPLPTVGAACFAATNCASGQLCVKGQCAAAEAAHEGQACSAIPCETGLRCASNVCTRFAQPGEACSADDDCSVGGCVERDDGQRACGAKCTATLDALHPVDGRTKMRLPSVPKRSNTEKR